MYFQRTSSEGDHIPIETFDYGECHLSSGIVKSMLKNKEEELSLKADLLNREDYMYTLKNDVTKLSIKEGVQIYVEQSQAPGFDFFFGKLLETLDISYIKPYTTYFTMHDTVLQFTECLSEGFTYPEVIKTYNEDFIQNLINKDVFSEAILVSLLINPSSIGFSDIVLRSNRRTNYHIYIKSFESYNAYAYTTTPEVKLRIKNALLLFDAMQESFSPEIMRKYAGMNVQEKIRDLFKKLRHFCDRMQQMQDKLSSERGVFKYSMPFLAVPFEDDFTTRFSERFERVSDIFRRCLQTNTTITRFDLLEKLSPVAGVYYRCLNELPIPLKEKWEHVERFSDFKTSFVESSLFQFFASFSQYQINEQSFYPNSLEKLRFIGVSQCLLKLKDEHSKNLVFHTRDEKQIVDLLLKEQGNNIEYYMRNLEMGSYSHSTQKLLVDIIKQLSVRYQADKRYKPFESFYLIGCSIIQENTFTDFGF